MSRIIIKPELQQCITFKAKYSIGTSVRFWPGAKTNSKGIKSTTISGARLVDGIPVVFVSSYAKAIPLDRVEPIKEDVENAYR